jgi:hypothetical protein
LLKNTDVTSAAFLPAGRNQPEDFAIALGGTIALTGLSIQRAPDALIVSCRWRCLRRPDRDYWCFLHVIDPAGKIVGQLDHRLLGGAPPLQSWTAGDSGTEELRITLPQPAAALRLRIGLYDPPSGDRAPIGPLPAGRFALADGATALIAPI